MINVSIALFIGAAILGFTMLIILLQKRKAPKAIVFSHGGIAATGLILLIIYAVRNPHTVSWISLALFPVAALVGIYMVIRDLSGKKFPLAVVLIHAAIALTAFAALFIQIFGWNRMIE